MLSVVISLHCFFWSFGLSFLCALFCDCSRSIWFLYKVSIPCRRGTECAMKIDDNNTRIGQNEKRYELERNKMKNSFTVITVLRSIFSVSLDHFWCYRMDKMYFGALHSRIRVHLCTYANMLTCSLRNIATRLQNLNCGHIAHKLHNRLCLHCMYGIAYVNSPDIRINVTVNDWVFALYLRYERLNAKK